MIPSTGFWWFDDYPGFRAHLDRSFRAQFADENVAIFDLRAREADTRAVPPSSECDGDPNVVSVILPVHNGVLPRIGSLWLRETIESVLAQEEVGVELMIVNDGSVDATARVLDHDPWSTVNVLTLQKPRGYAAAMNLGIEAASGAFIACTAVGDLYTPGKLARQIEGLHRA